MSRRLKRLAKAREKTMRELQIAVAHFETEQIGPQRLFTAAKKAVSAEFLFTMYAEAGE